MAIINNCLLVSQFLLVVFLLSASQTNAQAADIIFIIDTSSSDVQSRLDNRTSVLIQDTLSVFDVGLGPGQTRVGAVAIRDGKLQTAFKLSAHASVESLVETLDAVHMTKTPRLGGGSKSVKRAVASMFESHNGGRADAAHVVVTISSGGAADNDSSAAVIAATKLIERSDAVLTVSVQEEVINTDLMEAASNPGLYFVLNGNDNDTETLNTVKLELIRTLIEVCSRQYYDVTIAYDSNPRSAEDKEIRLQQLEMITGRLQNSSCYAHVRVISGSELSEKAPGLSPNQNRKRPGVRATIRKWRKGLLSRQRRASEGGPGRLPSNIDVEDQSKRLVLMLSDKHESEFRSVVSELRVVMKDGTRVLVVLDETVKPNLVLAWQQVMDFSRVVVPTDTGDVSEEIEDFICDM